MNLSTTAFLQDPVFLGVSPQRSLHVVINASVSSAHYTIVGQSRDEIMFPDNSPNISMWPYMISSAKTNRLNTVSVYADRGTSRDQARLLYMNSAALRLWREMGRPVTIVGEINRPPRTATLSFGMPFAD